ncbi:MAG TPA: toll/interleukin-1 receptor domain-containing protein [Verrucomicrobiae bacterium]|nr:toll/interleukin-1 receptor domain-containing protein [Verrucomicrobiae bacterium]
MYDAFISYARGDLSFADSLLKGLDAEGLRAFVDVHSLRAGQEWPPQLGAALRKSLMMVLCWSAQALASE